MDENKETKDGICTICKREVKDLHSFGLAKDMLNICEGCGQEKEPVKETKWENGFRVGEQCLRQRIPRIPTEIEIAQLKKVICEKYNLSDEECSIEEAYISVWEHYITDSPGYAGILFVCVYGGGPEYHEVWIRDKSGKLILVEKEIAEGR